MDYFKGIIVEMKSEGHVLPFYDDPDVDGNEDLHKRTHYVEARTGASFEVNVVLTPDFDFGGCDALKIILMLDGGKTIYKLLKAKMPSNSARNHEFVFQGLLTFCSKTSTWKRGSFRFGSLETSEIAGPNLDLKHARQLGKIQLEIFRVMLSKIRPISPKWSPLSRVTTVSEKTLKGQAITNTVDCVYNLSSHKPQKVTEIGHRCYGSLGESVFINLCYRSKHVLQILGCIARSPSLVIETNEDDPAEELARAEQELQLASARVARLRNNVKAESTSQIKREYSAATKTEPSNKRARTGVPEIVDLTAD